MLKAPVSDTTLTIDGEWIPDVVTGRRAYGLPAGLDDAGVRLEMWKRGGATAENPKPYLKVMFCQIVALTGLMRRAGAKGEDPELNLVVIPDLGGIVPADERVILERFWSGVGKLRPQIIGWNVGSADLAICAQRAIIHGIACPAFARPEKAWTGIDYFDDRNSPYVTDLKKAVAPWEYRDAPRLSEFAASCGLPGKPGVDGGDVLAMWLAGDWQRITAYNVCDVLTTHLVWLRLMGLCGFMTRAAVEHESALVRDLAVAEADKPGGELIRVWLEHWPKGASAW